MPKSTPQKYPLRKCFSSYFVWKKKNNYAIVLILLFKEISILPELSSQPHFQIQVRVLWAWHSNSNRSSRTVLPFSNIGYTRKDGFGPGFLGFVLGSVVTLVRKEKKKKNNKEINKIRRKIPSKSGKCVNFLKPYP